jgi:Domain of unknown function (DUF4129)
VRLPYKRGLAALLLGCCVLLSQPAGAAPPQGQEPGDAAIASAVVQLRTDPNLGGKHKIRTLHWIDSTPDQKDSPLLDWFVRLFSAIAGYGRVIAWTLGAVVLAISLLWVIRFFGRRPPSHAVEAPALPTHISNLDIRPEGLPADIGAAARDLWIQGQHRAALSLLYRGALSRLVNRYSVPIHSSSTEGECIEAAARSMDHGALAYFRDLVAIWQRATYAGELPAEQSLLQLCRNFSATMDARQT